MTEFYRHYRRVLYAAVFRIVRNRQSAEDVLQESLLKIWNSIALYDASQSHLFTWAAKVCCNTAIDHVRTSRYRQTLRTDSLEDTLVKHQAAPGGFCPEHVGITDLLGQLRPEYRQVMELLYLRGFTQVEAADELRVPLGTVKTWSLVARRHLSQLAI